MITATHPEYDVYAPAIERCELADEGSVAIKSDKHAKTFLPMLYKQTDKEYETYLERALWTGFTGRTVQAMKGLAMRRDPVVELPGQIDYLLSDADGQGTSLRAFIGRCLDAAIKGKRFGILVDRPVDGGQLYLTLYDALAIVNWREDESLYVLRETYEREGADDYDIIIDTRYRELALDEAIYTQSLWTKDEGTGEWRVEESSAPRLDGQALDEIPFVDGGDGIGSPMILPLADVNIAHYRNSADMESGLHLCGLPKPYVTGVQQGQMGQEFRMGAESLLTLPDVASKAAYLEFSGQGLGPLKIAMDDKVLAMSTLGARLIDPPRRGVEAAETARIHASAGAASLHGAVDMVENAVTDALELAAMFERANPEDVSVDMNKDFVTAEMEPSAVTAAVNAYLNGGLSLYALVSKMKSGEWLPKDSSVEDEMARINEEQLSES